MVEFRGGGGWVWGVLWHYPIPLASTEVVLSSHEDMQLTERRTYMLLLLLYCIYGASERWVQEQNIQ